MAESKQDQDAPGLAMADGAGEISFRAKDPGDSDRQQNRLGPQTPAGAQLKLRQGSFFR